MIVKPSALRQTQYMQAVLAIPEFADMTDEVMDTPIPWVTHYDVHAAAEQLDVRVAFVDGTGVCPERGCYGFATDDGEPAVILYLERHTPKEIALATLKHEYHHVKQMREGRLAVVNSQIIWNGEAVASIPVPHCNPTTDGEVIMHTLNMLQYYAQPWEFEANEGLWEHIMPDCKWINRLIETYGTTWPAHWSPEYVYKRLLQVKSMKKLLNEFEMEGL